METFGIIVMIASVMVLLVVMTCVMKIAVMYAVKNLME